MRILYFVPHLNTIYAGRTIYNGYKNAFIDLGHTFDFLTAEDNHDVKFSEFAPDILITSIHSYIFKFLDMKALKRQKSKGMKVFVNTPFWKSPLSKLRINEASSLSSNTEFVKLIKSGDYGDAYYNVCSQGDKRMEGFEETTGYKHHTIPLAADKFVNFYEFKSQFQCDVSFLGTNLPDKQAFFKERLYPLKQKYNLKLFGQDWSTMDKLIGIAAKAGMYFNLPILKNVQKPKLALENERQIYSSSTISLNIHESYQREYGGDCNERTLKIPLCGGFEITDEVSCIKDYFIPDKEIVIAASRDDWFDKIDYYLNHPDQRNSVIEAGKQRVLKDHTYRNRVVQMEDIYSKLST